MAQVSAHDGMFFLVQPGMGDGQDIYAVWPGTESTPLAVTQSSGISEMQPVVSYAGSLLAYFGVDQSSQPDLYVLQLPDGIGSPITYQTGESLLHRSFEIEVCKAAVWSPDDEWLAFLARQSDGKGDAMELFIARADGSLVRRLSENGNTILDMAWIDAETLVYVENHGDGSQTIYTVSVNLSPPQPALVATISSH